MKPNQKTLSESPKKLRGRIMFPSSHDIFLFNLPTVIEYLAKWFGVGNEILITTKPSFECIKTICNEFYTSYRDKITFRFTIGSLNDNILKFWEPNAPSLQERLASLTLAYELGYKTSISCEPFFDQTIFYLVDIVKSYVSDVIWIGTMNHINLRVDTGGWSTDDWFYMGVLQESYQHKNIEILYNKFKNDSKIIWKDSIRKMLK